MRLQATVTPALTEKQANARMGTFAKETDHCRVFSTACSLTKPDGTPLAVLIKGGITRADGTNMWRAIRGRISLADNRGTASGAKKIRRRRKDGTVSNQMVSSIKVHSAVLGFFDRSARFPFCRQAAINGNEPDVLAKCLPAIQQAEACFSRAAPAKHSAQQIVAKRTASDFLIPGTCFTTITLNKNFRTAYHKDAGDLAEGFAVMSYYRAGRFTGGNLVFPRYRVALAMDSFDVVVFDAHEVHGNTAINPISTTWERVTCVHYYRSNMQFCGSAEDELRHAASHDQQSGPRRMNQSVGG